VNGCSAADFAANDRTADDAERILRGPDGPAPAQFSPHCMRVRVGQTVAWTADLTSHSMSYVLVSTVDGGFGDAATTFVLGGDGGHTEDTAQASEPMTISFTCSKHPTLMFGAVEVVP
jgi:plastocyanin